MLNSKDKAKFRATLEWKNFRKKMLLANRNEMGRDGKPAGYHCVLCGSRKKSARALDLHHIEPENYDNLDPSKFALLDTKCHEFVEWMAIRVRMGGVYRQDILLEWVGPFLPKIVRKYGATKESL